MAKVGPRDLYGGMLLQRHKRWNEQGCDGLNGRGAQSRKVTKKNTKMLELAATLDYFLGIKEPAMRKEKSW